MPSIHCPVCWGPIVVVQSGCARCQTPHHEDCFAFMGGCAIFGCGGKTPAAISPPSPEMAIEVVDLPITPLADGGQALPGRTWGGTGGQPLERRFRRGMFARMGDAWSALFLNWGLSLRLAMMAAVVPLVGSLLLGMPASDLAEVFEKKLYTSFSPHRWVGVGLLVLDRAQLVSFLSCIILVGAMVARARGKEYGFCELLGRALGRFLPVVWACVRSGLAILGICIVGCGGAAAVSMAIGAIGGTAPAVIVGLVSGAAALVWVFRFTAGMALVLPVAAMGPPEEPEDALRRSQELVSLGPWHVLMGVGTMQLVVAIAAGMISMPMLMVGYLTMGAAGRIGLEFVATVIVQFLMLGLPFYLFLLYVEARRVLEGGLAVSQAQPE